MRSNVSFAGQRASLLFCSFLVRLDASMGGGGERSNQTDPHFSFRFLHQGRRRLVNLSKPC